MRQKKSDVDLRKGPGAPVAVLEAAQRPDRKEKPCRIRLEFAGPENDSDPAGGPGGRKFGPVRISGHWAVTVLAAVGALWGGLALF